MLWHKIARKTGCILMSCNATSKDEAVSKLGEGYVVSDVSWRLDVFKFQPIKTVVTDVIQVQKPRAMRLPTGYIGTAEACCALGVTERRFRVLTRRYRIRPKRLKYGARFINGYTPLQVEALRQCL
jgi:hypothetical protein